MKNITEYLEQKEALEKAQEELTRMRGLLTDDELTAVLSPPLYFVEYKGRGGPTPAQIKKNNAAILSIVRELGFQCACIVPEDEILLDGSEDFDIVVFRLGTEIHDIGYDRWGFISDSGELDQATWKQTVAWLVQLSKLL